MSYLGETEYFSCLLSDDKRSHAALEKLVDDLHGNKERTVTSFLCHSGSEDFLWRLVKLLAHANSRVAGNAAYIIGTLAESELGCYRVLSLTKSRYTEGKRILENLSKMLTFDDSESVMNAAGTLGTLAESPEGREWVLSDGCIDQTLDHITSLLQNNNMWTASNAALVLARLSISEKGSSRILNHTNSQSILSQLVLSLGVDEAGRGMNAAFALGRLCDTNDGRKRLIALPESDRMISSLAKMLSSKDAGVSKNSCFALSCLATSLDGHSRLLGNQHCDHVIKQLCDLMTAEDTETGWFAAMTLRTIASQPKGCLKLRGFQYVSAALKAVESKPDVNPDLKEEVMVTMEILKRLQKPSPPHAEVIGAFEVKLNWEEVKSKSGFDVSYQIFEGSNCVYDGSDRTCVVKDLTALTQYNFRLRACTEGDDGPFSEAVSVITEETVPSPPLNVRVLGCTATQLKIGWDEPETLNGILKGYYIYHNGNLVEHTYELMCILSSLLPATAYEVEVCASTTKGKGCRANVVGTTSEVGAHAPPKPDVMVMGRNEVHVTWRGPDVPLGRITRFDLSMNKETIYSGTDHSFSVRRLTPDTEYSFVVTALTSEGKFESKPTKKRTAKDEYEVTRAPLYQTPIKKEDEQTKPTPTDLKKRKSISNQGEKLLPRTLSASSKSTGSSFKLCRTWTKIDFDRQVEDRQKGHRSSPEQEKVKDKNEWSVESSYTAPYVNKGSSSLVGSNTRDQNSSFLGRSKRSNSENYPKGTQLYDRLSRPVDKRNNSSWSKSVFPLNLGSLSKNEESENVAGVKRKDWNNLGNNDLFTHIDAFGGGKSKTSLNRKDLERLRPITKKEKFPGKEAMSPMQIDTPTWAPPADLINMKAPLMHNKFVPMQFRTQPANLSLGQIQRTNTQVLEAKGFGGMNLKRVENLSRSLTQLDMKSSNLSSATTKCREHSLGSENSKETRLASGSSTSPHKCRTCTVDVS